MLDKVCVILVELSGGGNSGAHGVKMSWVWQQKQRPRVGHPQEE